LSYRLSKSIKFKIYIKNIILPVVLYRCEKWSRTTREENRLRVSENWVLRRIIVHKKKEGAGNWRRLHKEELYNL
jgi:hypothetical protein